MSNKFKRPPEPKQKYTVVDSDSALYRRGIDSDDILQEDRVPRPQRTQVRTRRRNMQRDLLKKPSIPPAFFSAAIIVLAAVVLTVSLLNSQGLSAGNVVEWIEGRVLGMEAGAGYPVKVAASQAKANNFQLLDGHPVLLSDTALLLYNQNGAQVSERQHGYANPAMCVGATRVLTYDLGGYGYRLETHSGIDFEGRSAQRIFTAAISSGGVYALATAGDAYASTASVYNRSHKQIYARSFQDTYITAMDVRSDGKMLAVGGLYSANGGVSSSLDLLSFQSEETVAKFEFSDTIILAVRFLSGGQVVAVGDRAAYLIDAAYQECVTFAYQSRTIQDFDIDPGTGIALALTSADGKASTLILLGKDGKSTAELETNYPCTAVCYTGQRVYLLSEDRLFIYSEELDLESEQPCDAICTAVRAGTADCYLLSASHIWRAKNEKLKF